jgi:hypothetical protein
MPIDKCERCLTENYLSAGASPKKVRTMHFFSEHLHVRISEIKCMVGFLGHFFLLLLLVSKRSKKIKSINRKERRVEIAQRTQRKRKTKGRRGFKNKDQRFLIYEVL